jgi:hypothetical protein
MTPSPDPRNLSPDQRELLDVCEQVALLTPDASQDDVIDAFDAALTLMEARVLEFHGRERLLDDDLFRYRAGFVVDGHHLATEGVQRMIDRLAGEVAHSSASN